MRLMLAKLLIARNDALLLDEPTNHLDLESMLWLENFLKAFEGTIIMVSHDRAFLNLVCNRTAEIEQGKIEVYPGNYEYYERTKAEREAQLMAASANIEARRKELERFVERFRYSATKARQAQSRVKMLDRMQRIELGSHGKAVHFSFPPAPPSGRMVFEIEGGAKSYDGIRDIFSSVDLRIERGDRVAFLGRNGEGKTTMGKILAGQEPLTGGLLTLGHNVTLGYYAQHQAEALKPELSVLETLESVTRAQLFHGQSSGASTKSGSGPRSMAQIRTLLGAFLFQGDDVFKPVRVLSGGEKSRLALAKMLLEPVNTLILDEPTNHLDVQSKEVVKEALLQFDGTVIVISHDRDFLEDLTDRLITFGNGNVKEYPNPIEVYLDELRSTEIASIRAKRAAPATPKPEPKQKAQAPVETKKIETNKNDEHRKRIEAEERNKKYKQEKPMRDKISRLEKQIEKLEKEKLTIEDGMYDPGYYSDAERVKVNAARIVEIKGELEKLMFEWAGMNEKLGSPVAS